MGYAGDDRALEILNKVKRLYVANWRGEGFLTNEQLAEIYEVPVGTIQSVARDNRKELETDGLRVLRGEALREVKAIIAFTSSAPHVRIWSPRAALHAGLMLRDSEVAKQVRILALNIIDSVNPARQEIPVIRVAPLVPTESTTNSLSHLPKSS